MKRRNESVSKRWATTDRASTPISCEEIARVAYELFERRGHIHGHDQDDWLTAEHIVRERVKPS